jgi:competence protein ComFC
VARIAEAVRAQLRGVREALSSLVFPAPCRICGQILDTGNRIPFCHSCLRALKQELPDPLCTCCGRPIVSTAVVGGISKPQCHLCRNQVYDFDFARSFGAYSPPMAGAILLLKYGDVTPIGTWFAQQLAALAGRQPQEYAADAVVPVPLDRGRLRERGYNQAELIAKPLAFLLRIPFRSYLLVRTRPRPNQLRLTRRERWDTVRGAYATQETAQVDKLRVLLVDDVFTTGATLDACSRALKRAGAAWVACLTVARALPQMPAPEGGSQYQDLAE